MKARPITCVICGNETARETVSKHEVHLLGRSATYESRQFECAKCGEAFTNDRQGAANEAAERRANANALAVIGGKEVRFLRELVGVTQPEFENALGLGKNTLARWETGQRAIPPYVKNLLRLVALNPTALLILRDQELAEHERVGVHVLAGAFDSVPKYETSRAIAKFSVPPPSVPPSSIAPPSFVSSSLGGGDDDLSLEGALLRLSFSDDSLIQWEQPS